MAHFKILLFLSLLFTIVLVFSSKASADNEPGVAQTQGGEQVDHHGGGWHCHRPHCKEGAGGDETHRAKTETKSGEIEKGGEQVDHHGGGWHCHHPHCKEGAGGDDTHRAETETKSGEIKSTNRKP
ncbi:uncharacterized protein LOC111366430 [Olea europaea var. sylvestris]|uniref:uncharacterized protein LOC111366430 n=1 Tax=Olea europaea var. sylvestris TaxID=158386 RepID=UPI000C1D87ED|nr:uncharacterized protein LOC111366430 [Olea europaea var. sylvestris]